MRTANRYRMRRTAAVCALVFLLTAATALAGDVVMTAPVYLNGLPEYTRTGSAGLANVACDAALDAAGTDVALLNGGLLAGSLPAGAITYGQLAEAFTGDPDLVVTEVTGSELTILLNDLLVYGSDSFPQLAGARVMGERSLTADGEVCGVVTELEVQGSPVEAGTLYRLVTTQELYADVYHLPREAVPAGCTVLEALTAYGSAASPSALDEAARAQRIQIISESINVPLAAAQLVLPVPTPVVCDLSRPDVIPDTLTYALMGQDRFLCADFPLPEIPYTLCLNGTALADPVSVDTELTVSQTVPPGRKTANTFSKKTVFVDLRGNETVPEGSLVRVSLENIYPPGMLLFLYCYDDNGDIIPLEHSAVIAEDAAVTFPVTGGMTYVINDRELNQSALLPPTPQHPWTGAIAAVFAVFCVWIVFAVLRIRRRRAAGSPRL